METKIIILIVFSIINVTLGAESLLELKDDDLTCTTSGPKCHSCWSSLNCIDLGNGTIYPELQNCPMGRTCQKNTGTCEPNGYYECSDVDKFECHNTGMFSSPYNCMEYFTCVTGPNNTLLKYVDKCEPTYEYDPDLKLCRRKVVNDNRYTSLIPVCRQDTQTGPVPKNANIYYRCQKESVALGFNFIPQLYRCPFNHQFTGSHCADPMPIFLDENGMCSIQGSFSDPINCGKYYECGSVGESPLSKTCNDYQKFDQSRGNCVYFSCDTCRDLT